ncbi:glutamyl-tRNA synthetase [Didymella exigua CBS 183.55]|uniref:Glutamate--tRNA ligase, mitochondrial n=1 Tax=Didymella exigua CBS 183.55 TaxID=1150837 RepID=A0A6A5RIG2_9PLEO|nr:glutamyl-tRNA synthetase [Didymella exigua CBS 183.55]KAF1927602.1 glutamyl-tRNA synthetase [Didymella exigua CBS 183.55]
MSFSLPLRPQVPAHICRSCLVRISSSPRRTISSKIAKEQIAKERTAKEHLAKEHIAKEQTAKEQTAKEQTAKERTAKEQKSNATLPSTPARTRFAPSPTGYLHLGSLRTALFNYLLAKSTGGQFLLRIEDTDQKRTVADAEERLLKDLRWAGLQWDEGPEVGGPYGPYKQSERSAIYREHAQQLLDSGHAYRCFCSAERLHALAEHKHKLGLATDYDRTCESMPQAESDERAHRREPHVVRLRVPDQYPAYKDLVYGTFRPLRRRGHVAEASFEDPILLKSDGLPTYHLANVVDDHLMRITHVIRGSEWMPSTPKHMALYTAFGWTPPLFAHVGLLVDEAGNKLSKRNFDTDMAAFQDMHILPETLTNFAALLGWSHREKTDVMTLAQLASSFSLKFTKGNTTVTFGKLHFLQRKHAHQRAQTGGPGLQDMVSTLVNTLTSAESPYPASQWRSLAGADPAPYMEKLVLADAENYTNANEFLYRNAFLLAPLRPCTTRKLTPDTPADVVEGARALASVPAEKWERDALVHKVREIIDARPQGKKGGSEVYHYLRLALSGQETGMRVYDMMLILGRDETLARLGVDGEGV